MGNNNDCSGGVFFSHMQPHAQGIPWEDLHPPRTRQEYRELRLHSYPNYQNLIHVCELHRDDIQRDALQPETVRVGM